MLQDSSWQSILINIENGSGKVIAMVYNCPALRHCSIMKSTTYRQYRGQCNNLCSLWKRHERSLSNCCIVVSSTIGNEGKQMSCWSVGTQEIRSGEDAYKYLIEDTIAYVPDEWCFLTDTRIWIYSNFILMNYTIIFSAMLKRQCLITWTTWGKLCGAKYHQCKSPWWFRKWVLYLFTSHFCFQLTWSLFQNTLS